ncbi:MAG TPA: hypothetical protein VFN22_06590 [Gemmatimonadales bacterium]|nr:hypothetical protein [Gemmatimonadales bacterium]
MPRACLTRALVLLAVVACSEAPTGGSTPPTSIRIDGNNVGPSDGLVFITQGGQSVTDASVTVTANGSAATPTNGGYYWQLGTPLAAGATLTVQATRLGASATVVGTLPATPVITAPAPDAPVTIGTPLTVTWTSASDPAYFVVHLGYRVGNTGTSVSDSVAGHARAVDLATTAIPAGATNLEVDIRAVGSESRSGDVTTDSKLRLHAATENRALTLNAGP